MMIGAVQAGAVPPETATEDFVEELEFSEGEVCDFPVKVTFVGSARARLFVNKDGNPKKAIVHLSDHGTFTNAATGESVSGHDAWTEIYVPTVEDPDTVTSVGLSIHFNVPGAGIVFIEAGKVVFDGETGEVLVAHGKHQFLDEDFDAICAALS